MKWLWIGLDGGLLWTGSQTLGFVQNVEFFELFNNYQFFDKDTVPPTSQNTNDDRLNFNSAT
jgi:hypothetical protein